MKDKIVFTLLIAVIVALGCLRYHSVEQQRRTQEQLTELRYDMANADLNVAERRIATFLISHNNLDGVLSAREKEDNGLEIHRALVWDFALLDDSEDARRRIKAEIVTCVQRDLSVLTINQGNGWRWEIGPNDVNEWVVINRDGNAQLRITLDYVE